MSHYYQSAVEAAANPSSEIHNGARCKLYSWSQSHSDLEIAINLTKAIKQDQITVGLSRYEICVEVTTGLIRRTLMKGKFEHQVDTESAYWIVEKECPKLVVFIDKVEDMWWKKLLENEQASEQGPKHFSVPMDTLDEESRMVIDKLVNDQKKKLLAANNSDNLSPA